MKHVPKTPYPKFMHVDEVVRRKLVGQAMWPVQFAVDRAMVRRSANRLNDLLVLRQFAHGGVA